MSYPADGCTYVVNYLDESGGRVSVGFSDEFELGRWLKAKVGSGELSPEDQGKDAGFTIHCISREGAEEIDYLHPRLVRGRMEEGRDRS